MKTKLLYIVILLAILGGGLYLTSYSHTNTKSSNAVNPKPMDASAMEQHMKDMDDGKSIMAMGSKISPATLYVKQGATLRFANHEATAMSLIMGTETLAQITESGKESTFQAPTDVGTYHFVSSINQNLSGTIVVEQ